MQLVHEHRLVLIGECPKCKESLETQRTEYVEQPKISTAECTCPKCGYEAVVQVRTTPGVKDG